MKTSNLIKATILSAFAASSWLVPVAIAQTSSIWQSLPKTQRQISQATSLQAMEQSVFNQINQYRKSRGLSALTLDSRITAQAQAHSQAMASGRVPFSHDGFQQRVQIISRSIPYSNAAENVSYSKGYQDPATQAVQGWLKSSGHKKNIEGKYDLTGIGAAKNAKGEYYFTQIFIKRR